METLPNLHTLQVCHAHSVVKTALETAFNGKQYPQIRTIVLPSSAHNILRACPRVADVTCIKDDGGTLLAAIRAECRDVEVIDGFKFTNAMLERALIVAAGYRLLISVPR